jgi:hypothetical protein
MEGGAVVTILSDAEIQSLSKWDRAGAAVLDLFRRGRDTAEIAKIINRKEPEVCRLLAAAREFQRKGNLS